MSGEHDSKTPSPPRAAPSRERDVSGIAPFLEMRFRRRGRSVSRIVAVQMDPTREVFAHIFEAFFALG